jgi:hypothetical protein
MPQIIIEEYARGSAHNCYHRVEKLPATIGRAFNNDIVLSDPYVSPIHLTIDKSGNGWVATDLGSENGSFIRKNRRIDGAAEVVSGDLITVGRTQLRLWSPEHIVPDALPLPARQSPVHRFMAPLLAIAGLIVVSMALTLQQFLECSNQKNTVSLFASGLPYLFYPLLWAGMCACAGYIVRRRAFFSLQLIVADCAFLSVLALTLLSEYVDYFSSSVRAADLVQYSGMVAISAILLYINLSLATGNAGLRRAVISTVIGGGIIAAVALTDYASRIENRLTPEYSQTLKPPYAPVARSISPEQFIRESEHLFDEKKDPQGH